MPPKVASVVVVVLILALLWLARDGKAKASRWFWVPVAWLALSSSRSVAQWMQGSVTGQSFEGNPTDRAVYTGLVALGAGILATRASRVREVLKLNSAIIALFAYCTLSIAWSDSPDIAVKRLIKAMGDVIMVLVVLTDRYPAVALRRFIRWPAFVLLPLSILFVKYYPDLGRAYSPWEGTASYMGIATTKNALGMICLLFGLGSVWSILRDCSQNSRERKRQTIAHAAVLLMAVWLCHVSNSMTSMWCLILGSAVVVATGMRMVKRQIGLVHPLVVGVVLVPFATLFLGIGSDLAHGATGRNISTLTDRTDVWRVTLGLAGSSLFGTGFESFWLGPRLAKIWSVYWWHPTEAHNGYLEVYLNLGWVGIALLGVVIFTGYRTMIAALRKGEREASLRIALLAVGIVYNFTEAAFVKMMTPTWIFFLLAAMKLPPSYLGSGNGQGDARSAVLPHDARFGADECSPRKGPASQWRVQGC